MPLTFLQLFEDGEQPMIPAVKIDGNLTTGHKGQTHYDLIAHWIWKNEFSPMQREDKNVRDAYDRLNSDWMAKHKVTSGFVDPKEGDFISRPEAWKRLMDRGYTAPEDLSVYVPRGETVPHLDSVDMAKLVPPATA